MLQYPKDKNLTCNTNIYEYQNPERRFCFVEKSNVQKMKDIEIWSNYRIMSLNSRLLFIFSHFPSFWSWLSKCLCSQKASGASAFREVCLKIRFELEKVLIRQPAFTMVLYSTRQLLRAVSIAELLCQWIANQHWSYEFWADSQREEKNYFSPLNLQNSAFVCGRKCDSSCFFTCFDLQPPVTHLPLSPVLS